MISITEIVTLSLFDDQHVVTVKVRDPDPSGSDQRQAMFTIDETETRPAALIPGPCMSRLPAPVLAVRNELGGRAMSAQRLRSKRRRRLPAGRECLRRRQLGTCRID